MTTPTDGCRWCGKPAHNHGWQNHSAAGPHQWVKPTLPQIKDRMLARRQGANT